jgi:hypothetical protein
MRGWYNKLIIAKEGFMRKIYLCRDSVEENSGDYWRLFDLGDAVLFSEQYDEARLVYSKAIELVPAAERQDKLSSVLGPLRDYLAAGVLQGPLLSSVQKLVLELEMATS